MLCATLVSTQVNLCWSHRLTCVDILAFAQLSACLPHDLVGYPVSRRQNFRIVQIETNCRQYFRVHLKCKISAM